jgi:hypothetical protein
MAKKRKSPLDILMDTIAEAEANITSASAELAYATGKRRVERARERGLDLGDGNPETQHAYLASLPWLHFRDDRQRALLVGDGDRAAPRVLAAARAVVGPGEPSEQLANASAVALAWQDNEMPKSLLPHLVPAVPDAKEPPRGR